MKKIEDFLHRSENRAMSICILIPSAIWWGPLYFFTDYFLTPGTERFLDLTSASFVTLLFMLAIVTHLRQRAGNRYIREIKYPHDQSTES